MEFGNGDSNVLFTSYFRNQIVGLSEEGLSNFLKFNINEDVDIIDLCDEYKIVIKSIIGQSVTKKEYLKPGYLTELEEKLDNNVSNIIHEGLVAMDYILRWEYDYEDAQKAHEFIKYVQKNKTQFIKNNRE